MAIRKVGVVGCGLMGSGIAQTCVQAGYETIVSEVNQQFLDKGTDTVGKLQGQADLEERYDSMELFDESSGIVDGGQVQSYD